MIAAETKSTAGDKYETARAMIHIEQEQINRQLAEALAQQSALAQIDLSIHSEQVVRGSLVDTDQGLFFISTSIGKMIVEDSTVYAISPQSPLGIKLTGLSVGKQTSVNGKAYTVNVIS
jgi:transcription elongation GreA/GreB family factor